MSVESEHRKRTDRVADDPALTKQVTSALNQVAKELRTPIANSSSVKSAQRFVGKPLPKRTQGRRMTIEALREIYTIAYIGGFLQNAVVLKFKPPKEFGEAEAIARAKATKVMTKDQFDQLDDWAKGEAFTAAGQTIESIEAARDIALINALENGDPLSTIVKALTPDWKGEGRVLSKLHIENVMRTNSLRAYNQGFNDVAFQPGMAERLPVARYSAVIDDRTSEICQALDGLLMDREAVTQYTPPLHFMCRSILLWETGARGKPVQSLSTLKRLPENQQPDPGFGAYKPATIGG